MFFQQYSIIFFLLWYITKYLSIRNLFVKKGKKSTNKQLNDQNTKKEKTTTILLTNNTLEYQNLNNTPSFQNSTFIL